MRRTVLLPLLFASALAAQARPAPAPSRPAVPARVNAPAAPPTTLSGFVYDSLIDAPLRGATVLLSATAASATTDTAGYYAMDVDSVPDGRYLLSFFHPSLDSIGIAPPPRTIVFTHGTSAVFDLAVPSAASILREVCPDSLRSGGRGLLIGDVRDAESDRPLAGALVVVMWTSMSIGNSSISRLPQALNVRTDSDGLFRLCGVPAQTPLRSQARLSSKASGWIDLAFEPGALVVQQFLIGERPTVAAASEPAGATAAAGAGGAAASPKVVGSATLTGTVVGGDGAPLEGAQVLLIGTTMTVSARSDFRGNFRLTGLPSGTHTVEVRLLSYQPKHYVVNLAPHKEARLGATLDARAQVLDPVTVVGKETSPIPGFDERKAHAIGVFLDEKQIKDANAISVSDIMRGVPGIQILFVNGQYVAVSSRNGNMKCKEVQWYVDGVQYSSYGEDMDELFKPYELEALEIYSSAATTPMQFQAGGGGACGTIVVWTKRAHLKPKAPPAN